MKWIGLFLLLFLADLAIAQKDHRYLRQGDRNYEENDLGAAEEAYRKALEAKETAKGTYNLGNTIYKQGRYDEAIKHYERAAESTQEPQARAHAYHNLGNAYFQQGDYAKSAEAYKNALRLNPADMETKINLAQAQHLIQPPPPEQDQQEGESEEQNEENQDQQQQQDQQSSGQDQQDQQQQEQDQQQQDQQSPAEAREQEENLSREEAERLLQIMANEEQKTMEKLRQAQSKACNSAKDW